MKQQANFSIKEEMRLEHNKIIGLRGEIEESRVVNEYADFRESRQLLTYSIHCCVGEQKGSRGRAGSRFCSLRCSAEAEAVRCSWVGVGSEIDSLQDPSRTQQASSTERDLVPH
jgi:hypothetical protein